MVEFPFSFNRLETFRILTIGYLFYIPFLWYSNQISLFSADFIFHLLVGLVLSLLIFPILYFPTTLVQTYLERILYWKKFENVYNNLDTPKKKSEKEKKKETSSNSPETSIENAKNWKEDQEIYKRAAIIWTTLDVPPEIRTRIKDYKNVSTLFFNVSFISIVHMFLSLSTVSYALIFSLICYTSFGGGIYFHALCLFNEISMWKQDTPQGKKEDMKTGAERIHEYAKRIKKINKKQLEKPLRNFYTYIFLISTGILIGVIFIYWLLISYWGVNCQLSLYIVWAVLFSNSGIGIYHILNHFLSKK